MDTADITRESSLDRLAQLDLQRIIPPGAQPQLGRPTVADGRSVRVHHGLRGGHAALDVDSRSGRALRLCICIDTIDVSLNAGCHDADGLFLRAALAIARQSVELPAEVALAYLECAAELERRCRRSLRTLAPHAGRC